MNTDKHFMHSRLKPANAGIAKPRLGFLGTGWIGKQRMEIVAASGEAEVAAVADTSAEKLRNALDVVKGAGMFMSLEEMLEAKTLDGVVIATPNALHADHCRQALEKGIPVFCQKPLGLSRAEVAGVVSAAREKDVLLGIDYTYRYSCFARLRHFLDNRELGRVQGIELCFHNAYGPDKAWFYDHRVSGGGCVMDLGIHLVDMALWLLRYPGIEVTSSMLSYRGYWTNRSHDKIEDYALVALRTDQGIPVHLTCSWNLPAGQGAAIHFKIYGTKGGCAFRNIGGSFYDFEVVKFNGDHTLPVVREEGGWGSGAILNWCARLKRSGKFDPEADSATAVADVIGAIYEKARN